MPSYLATDHTTQFVIFDDGALEMQKQAPSVDADGGMDFDWKTVGRFMLVDAMLGPDKLCPDFVYGRHGGLIPRHHR